MIHLRALEPEDLATFYEIENDMDVWQYGSANTPISLYALRQYIATCNNDIFQDSQLRLAIDVDGEMVGLVDMTSFNPLHRRAEVGIVVKKDSRQKGYGKMALEQLTDYARRVIGLHQLYAVVARDNESARRLFVSAGFIEAQALKDWLFSASGEVQDANLYQLFLVK